MISVLFGAGASNGSESQNIKTPPLGKDLFSELDRLGGYFNKLSNELKCVFLENGFESGMLEVPNDSRIINPLQNELAAYLSSFTPTINSAYVELFEKIAEINKINLITLNYDLLIEISLELCNTYGNHRNRLSPPLLKLHGSSNFIPDIPIESIKIKAFDCGGFFESSDIKILKQQEVGAWCTKTKEDFSPVMCMYDKNKKMVICGSYLTRAKKTYRDLIEKSNLIIIIGTKYIPHDKHVWDVILLNRKKRVVIIDPYPDSRFKSLILSKNMKNDVIEKSFKDSVDDIAKIINFESRKRSV
ncbi:hypothetical protein [Klebsiella quasipneumoniae]|uniref:SIR2-like domain-containing protein n=1 Tax=Klebsiella quasipneumoniae TaxID=1463165 RepID=A0ABD7N8Q5_9ENTR|nr:hypothetical protein [Klebsiella quasipneumoniae]SSG05945.1 Uncharacterised protein [Klebsiella quasipneumoniae]